MFHVERARWRAKNARFGVQRRHDELGFQLRNLRDEALEMLRVELGRRVVEEQRRGDPARRLKEAQLRQRHRHRDQLLLSTREELAGGAAVEPYRHVRTMRSWVGEVPRLIPRPGSYQCLPEALLLAPPAEVVQLHRQAAQGSE